MVSAIFTPGSNSSGDFASSTSNCYKWLAFWWKHCVSNIQFIEFLVSVCCRVTNSILLWLTVRFVSMGSLIEIQVRRPKLKTHKRIKRLNSWFDCSMFVHVIFIWSISYCPCVYSVFSVTCTCIYFYFPFSSLFGL